jgi:hypothetical protein
VNISLPELSLVVLIGASGSGKSTFARRHFNPTEVLNSDACRALVSDDENDQSATDDAFECTWPELVVVTTPNREYNVRWESLPAGKFRHRDHRFEWTRAEFEAWSGQVAGRFGYAVRFVPVGPVDAEVGAPTQMGVFTR